MINLLPPKRLLNMRVARSNTELRRYVELTAVSMVVLAVAVAAAYYFLDNQYRDSKQVAAINQAQVDKLKPVQEQAEQLSATVSTISGLLSTNVKFSDMLVQIGGLMPSGSVLTGTQFSLEDLEAPLVVSAQVETEEKAAVLRNNLVHSPLFSKAEIKSIIEIKEEPGLATADASTSTAQNARYKYTTTINAYFKENVGAKKP